jgi:uncharacterized protein YhdP
VSRRRIAIGALLVLALLLLGARAAAPTLIQRYVNRVLDRTEGYRGSIGDVDLALLRGAYTIENVRMDKETGKVPVPLFRAREVDLSIEWKALFDGSLVGEVWFDEPEVNFVSAPRNAAEQSGAEGDWRKTVKDLFPVKINRMTVRNGTVHFRNFSSEPPVDVYLNDVDATVRNLTNSKDLGGDLVARAELRARAMKTGAIVARAKIDPYADVPTFDVDASATNIALTDWNAFLRAYAGVDVQRGSLRLYAELKAEDGHFEGYVKPFLENVDVLDLKEEGSEQSYLASLWEALVGGTAEAVQDQGEDRVATRIPITGDTDAPQIGFWSTLGNVLRNAFVEAFVPALEHSVGEDRKTG